MDFIFDLDFSTPLLKYFFILLYFIYIWFFRGGRKVQKSKSKIKKKYYYWYLLIFPTISLDFQKDNHSTESEFLQWQSL